MPACRYALRWSTLSASDGIVIILFLFFRLAHDWAEPKAGAEATMTREITAISLAAVLVALGTGRVRADLPTFTITDLWAITGAPTSYASGVNNAGQVIGNASTSATTSAFLYSGGALSGLSVSGYQFQNAYGISDSGQVVGSGTTEGGPGQALLYSGGTIQDLGTVVGGEVSKALGVNDSGQVIGISVNGGGNTNAFIYNLNSGSITHILPAYQSVTYPLAINNLGQVVGYSGGNGTPFLYSNGSITYLPGFGGIGGSADGINNLGQVVGYSDLAGGDGLAPSAFLYYNGVMTDLGTFGATESWADAINDNGWIVGGTDYSDSAFLDINGTWSSLAALTINAQGWLLTEANAVSDSGLIVGYGLYHGVENAFLLTPVSELQSVPVPSTLLVAGVTSALIGAILAAKRGLQRRRRNAPMSMCSKGCREAAAGPRFAAYEPLVQIIRTSVCLPNVHITGLRRQSSHLGGR
jgi:probable HAF family extracellular repeat protein